MIRDLFTLTRAVVVGLLAPRAAGRRKGCNGGTWE